MTDENTVTNFTAEIVAALTPLMERVKGYFTENPEVARHFRILRTLGMASGIQSCGAIFQHANCVASCVALMESMTALALSEPEALEAVYQALKPGLAEMFPQIDFDVMESHEFPIPGDE